MNNGGTSRPLDVPSPTGWLHDGSKGGDFESNVRLPNLHFITVHLYPDNWQIPAADIINGWEDERSCRVPFCLKAASDPDGDGWGWEANMPCLSRAR